MANHRHPYPHLWHDDEENKRTETVNDLIQRFSSAPPPRSLWSLIRCSLVAGQEFALTCLLLASHRSAMVHQQDIDEWQHVTPMVVAPLALLIVIAIFYSERTAVCEALLLAGILRLISSVLRTLTASYSSDTVYALAISGMLVHLLACNYSYANGYGRKKAAFAGGVMSLNASLFSTTLLASRLSSNATVYVFVSASVILFAFYPAARHTIAVTQRHASNIFLAIAVVLSSATWALLATLQEKALFGCILLSICVVAPSWQYAVLQRHKLLLSGPWDIAHIVQDEG